MLLTQKKEISDRAHYLSTQAKAPIVPMAIYGAETAWEGLFRGIRPRVFVNIGKPFGPHKISGSKIEKQKKLQDIGLDMMCRIAALLPKNRQKTYKGDIRVEKYQKINNFIPKDHLYYKKKKK